MSDRLRFSTMRRPRRRQVLPGLGTFSGQMVINGTAAAFGVLLLAFLATGRSVLLPLVILVVAGGVDQGLRLHRAARFEGPWATVMYLFVPALYALGAAVFLRDVSHGWWNLPAAMVAALLLALGGNAEYFTVEVSPETYPNARFVLSLVSYLTAFAFFTVVSTSDLRLPAATLVVATVAMLLSVDILRELEVQGTTLFAYGATIAIVVAEVRWAMYYLALPDLLAGGLLLITFYELTGLTQSYLSGHLDRATIREFAGFGAAGIILIGIFSVVWRNA